MKTTEKNSPTGHGGELQIAPESETETAEGRELGNALDAMGAIFDRLEESTLWKLKKCFRVIREIRATASFTHRAAQGLGEPGRKIRGTGAR